MTQILKVIDSEAFVSHRVIAKEVFEFNPNKKGDEQIQLKNKMTQVKELITDNLVDFEEFGQLRFETESVRNSVGARNQEKTYFLNEPQATLLLTFMRNSVIIKAFKVRLVKEFFEMRKQLQNGSTPKNSFQERKELFQLDVIGLESSFKLLRVNEASKILMTKTLYTEHGLSTSYLPKYSDEQHTYSLSHLLKKYEVGISAKKLNLILLSEGYLEIKTRKSTGSFIDEKTKEKKPKLRTFKSLTEKGLEFGKNVISPHNQLETSPHYFENKFEELIEALKL